MRIVPWSEMDSYVSEFSGRGAWNTDPPEKLPAHLASDNMTYYYDKRDTEVAPLLSQEFKRRPAWLASRIFPLEPGDVLVRDVRVWHGGCPNLSQEARYLPGIEVASRELVKHFSHRFFK